MEPKLPDWLKQRLTFKTPKEEDSAAYPELEQISYDNHPCGDCNKTLLKQRIVEIKIVQNPFRHQQFFCKSCGFYMNPDTKEYNLTNQQLRAFFRSLKLKKDKY